MPTVPVRSIRPDYEALANTLPLLARQFNCSISDASHRDVATMLAAVESVDWHLDRRPTQSDRERFGEVVVARLCESNTGADDLPGDVGARIGELRQVLKRRGVQKPFARITRGIFRNAERMRTAGSISEYSSRACREGLLLVGASLLLLPEVDDRLRAWLIRMAGPANLADKLRDAQDDFRAGELAMRPGIRFYSLLATHLTVQLAAALWFHPHPWFLWRWARPLLRP